MSRPSYSVLTAGVIFTAVLLTQVVQGGGQAPAQAARPATATASTSSITPEQARPFLGTGRVTLSAGANDFSLAVAVTTEAGKVAATVGSDTQPTTNVT